MPQRADSDPARLAPAASGAEPALAAAGRLIEAAASGAGAVHAAIVREGRLLLEAAEAALVGLQTGAGEPVLLARAPGEVIAGSPSLIAPAVDAGEARLLDAAETAAVAPLLADARGSVVAARLEGAAGPGPLLLFSFAAEAPPALVAVATAFATTAGTALDHAARRTGALADDPGLAEAVRRLHESLDLREVLRRACAEAVDLLGADACAAHLGGPEDGLTAAATAGLPPEALGYRLPPGGALAGRVVATGRPATRTEHDGAHEPGDGPCASYPTALAAPLCWQGRVRGVLEVADRRAGTASPERLGLLERFADLAAGACANAGLHAGLAHTARTDGLTGCLNHAALQDALRREIDRSRRTDERFSLILLDLDDFHRLNERQGHLVGDEVLRRVAHALRQAVRAHDLVARYGGDEFAIVAVGADEREATDIAARAIDWLTSMASEYGEGELARRGHATAGIAEWSGAMSRTELLAEADRALVFGKRGATPQRVVPVSAVPDGFRPGRFGRVGEAADPPAADPPAAPAPEQTDVLRRRSRQLALTNDLGTRLSAMTTPAAIVYAAVDTLHEAFGYFGCAALMLREDGLAQSVAERGATSRTSSGRTVSSGQGAIGRCLREGRAVAVGEAGPGDALAEAASAGWSQLCVPVWAGERLWGVLDVLDDRADAFAEDDVRLVQTVADQVGAALRSALLYQRLERAYLSTAEALAAALEGRHGHGAGRARSVVRHADAVGRRLGMDDDSLSALRYGAALHDIGKLTVPESLLTKREPLTEDDRSALEGHTIAGEEILAPIELLADVRPLIRHARERFDGGGYPDGLEGEQIPLGARVILACTAWHAMVVDRPYRSALGDAEARAELARGAGSQFDPQVVEVLIDVLDADAAAGGDLPG